MKKDFLKINNPNLVTHQPTAHLLESIAPFYPCVVWHKKSKAPVETEALLHLMKIYPPQMYIEILFEILKRTLKGKNNFHLWFMIRRHILYKRINVLNFNFL
jgi:hypothetical protein